MSMEKFDYGLIGKDLLNSLILRNACAPLTAFLRDRVFVNFIAGVIDTVTIYLGQIAPVSDFSIADMCPFPVFGLLMMKRGAGTLTCFAETDTDKVFIEQVLMYNRIPLSKITILSGVRWDHEAVDGRMFHAIYGNTLSMSSPTLRRSMKYFDRHIKLAHLVPDGLYFPARVIVLAQAISSEKIKRMSRQKDFPKKFTTSMRDLGPYRPLSGAAVFLSRYVGLESRLSRVPVLADGECCAILCWLELAILRFTNSIDMRRDNSYINPIVFVLDNNLSLFKGDTATLFLVLAHGGSFSLSITTSDHA